MANEKHGTYENKYEPLYDYLMKETRADFTLTFEEIEEILGFGLPRSAHRAEWWDADTPEHPRDQAQAIHQALIGSISFSNILVTGTTKPVRTWKKLSLLKIPTFLFS